METTKLLQPLRAKNICKSFLGFFLKLNLKLQSLPIIRFSRTTRQSNCRIGQNTKLQKQNKKQLEKIIINAVEALTMSFWLLGLHLWWDKR